MCGAGTTLSLLTIPPLTRDWSLSEFFSAQGSVGPAARQQWAFVSGRDVITWDVTRALFLECFVRVGSDLAGFRSGGICRSTWNPGHGRGAFEPERERGRESHELGSRREGFKIPRGHFYFFSFRGMETTKK